MTTPETNNVIPQRGRCLGQHCNCENFRPWRHDWPREYPEQALSQPVDIDQRCYRCACLDTSHEEIQVASSGA